MDTDGLSVPRNMKPIRERTNTFGTGMGGNSLSSSIVSSTQSKLWTEKASRYGRAGRNELELADPDQVCKTFQIQSKVVLLIYNGVLDFAQLAGHASITQTRKKLIRPRVCAHAAQAMREGATVADVGKRKLHELGPS